MFDVMGDRGYQLHRDLLDMETFIFPHASRNQSSKKSPKPYMLCKCVEDHHMNDSRMVVCSIIKRFTRMKELYFGKSLTAKRLLFQEGTQAGKVESIPASLERGNISSMEKATTLEEFQRSPSSVCATKENKDKEENAQGNISHDGESCEASQQEKILKNKDQEDSTESICPKADKVKEIKEKSGDHVGVNDKSSGKKKKKSSFLGAIFGSSKKEDNSSNDKPELNENVLNEGGNLQHATQVPLATAVTNMTQEEIQTTPEKSLLLEAKPIKTVGETKLKAPIQKQELNRANVKDEAQVSDIISVDMIQAEVQTTPEKSLPLQDTSLEVVGESKLITPPSWRFPDSVENEEIEEWSKDGFQVHNDSSTNFYVSNSKGNNMFNIDDDIGCMTSLELSDLLLKEACTEIDLESHDLSLYICLHEIYAERYSWTRSAYDKENAEKSIATSLEIIDRSNAVGMVGWLDYGKSNVLDRALERPFDTLSNLAAFHASDGKWESATDILRSLVLRSEQQLPLYHPITITSLLDLSGALYNSGEKVMANKISRRAQKRLLLYLEEQEACTLKMHDMQSPRGSSLAGSDPYEYYKLVGLDHLGMLKTFARNMKFLSQRKMVSILQSGHPMKILNMSFLGDTYSVLACCLRHESKFYAKMFTKKSQQVQLCEESRAAWMLAGGYYKKSLRGWSRLNCSYQCNVMSTVCSLARCLHEIERRKEAIKILYSIIRTCTEELNSTSVVRKYNGKMPREHIPAAKKENNRSMSSSITIQSEKSRKEHLATCMWTLAIYIVEENPNEEGRLSAIGLLQSAITLLTRDEYERCESHKSLLDIIQKECNALCSARSNIVFTSIQRTPAKNDHVEFTAA